MSLEDLEQALFAAKWGNAEENGIEVVARVLELPVIVVERVLFAARCAKDSTVRKHRFSQLVASMDEGPTLSYELRRAIDDAVQTGLKRAAVRHAIQNDAKIYVRPSKLVGDRPRDVCNGCPHSIECVLVGASTPEKCVKKGVLDRIEREGDRIKELRRYCVTTPAKLLGNKVTVSCEHPAGTWTLDIEDVEL